MIVKFKYLEDISTQVGLLIDIYQRKQTIWNKLLGTKGSIQSTLFNIVNYISNHNIPFRVYVMPKK